VRYEPTGLAFDVQHGGTYVGHFAVSLYGRHNVYNSLAAIAVAVGEGVTNEQIQMGLASFSGASRRFEVVSAPQAAVTVIDDYAHHPTEIAATIAAVQEHFGRRVVAVVRPHTYSRVKELLPEYRRAVAKADLAFVTDIESAREHTAAATVSGADIARDNAKHVVFEPDRPRLLERLGKAIKPGDIVLCMTVGGYDGLAAELARLTSGLGD
jgi:UDP-N-acetylmuramate--alanine ligase